MIRKLIVFFMFFMCGIPSYLWAEDTPFEINDSKEQAYLLAL